MAARITPSKNAAGLVEYFDAELSRGDYYTARGNLPGQWFGKGADMLGLFGGVTRDEFAALAYNLHPETGEQITAAMRENRRPGYDITFSTPKSVSVLYEHLMATGQNAEALELLGFVQASVRDALVEVEENMQARVRVGGQNTDKLTGNIAAAMFTHFQARPVGGVADPHVHVHAYVFNMTHDGKNWKAGQFGQLSKDREYYEAFFDDRLAVRLHAMGYATELPAEALSFEVKGIGKDIRDIFSERTRQIEAKAKKDGITDPKQKAGIASRTRKNKETGLSPEENRERSHARLDAEKQRAIDALKDAHTTEKVTDADAFDYAESHWFARKSAVPEKRFLAEALKVSLGSGLSWRIKDALNERPGLVRGVDETGARLVTTEKIREEELAILSFARDGRQSAVAFADIGKARGITGHSWTDTRLSDEQKLVVGHVLRSTEAVMGIMGGAGTGKTTATAEVIRAITNATAKNVLVVAPTIPARDVLREDGAKLQAESREARRADVSAGALAKAETVAKLLVDQELQKQVKDGVIFVDEAGLMGTQDMRDLFELARAQNARVILQGDTKQHQSVKRGDALRLLEKKGAIAFASIKTIRRQENEAYRSAVESLMKGDTAEGYAKLDAMGAIREVANDAERYRGIAESYAEKLSNGHTAIVVAPTHQEIDKVTAAVRAKLVETGRLGKARNAPAWSLRAENLTDAERGNLKHYRPGQVVEFKRNAPGWKMGERATVWEIKDGVVTVLRGEGDKARFDTLDVKKAKAFDLYEKRELELAVGDIVRVTQGMKDAGGKRLERGSMYEVNGFDADGAVLLSRPGQAVSRKLDASDPLHLTHGYATTSHASQSLTRHHVIAALGSMSFAATSLEQFYVSLSRGKWSAEVWTDAKEALQNEIERSGKRTFALDVREDKKPVLTTPKPESTEALQAKLQARLQARRAKAQAEANAKPLSRVARMVDTAKKLLQRHKRLQALEDRESVFAALEAKPTPTAFPRTDVEHATVTRVKSGYAQSLEEQQQKHEQRRGR